MERRLRAYFCPCCGARLDPPGAGLVQCNYCDAHLEAQEERIQEPGQAPAISPQRAHSSDYPCRLTQTRQGRFEMSWLHQQVTGHELDGLAFFSVDEKNCALVYLRRCDSHNRTLAQPLPWEALTQSLLQFRDPGLAARTALQFLCDQPQGFRDRLECAICLFEEHRSRATVYAAGCRDSIYWLSNEQASLQSLAGHREALERRMLLEDRDHFSSQPTLEFASLDALVMVSAAYAGRGGGPYASGLHALQQELREGIGEDPLRLVTLAKNAFWGQRCPAAYDQPPQDSLHVLAVQARLPSGSGPGPQRTLQTLCSRCFESCSWIEADDFLELLSLHEDRQVLVWARNADLPFTSEQQKLLREAILEILDRKDHGDNENPRVAGRLAQNRVNLTQLAVFLLLDRYQRVKYFRLGCPHPVYLPPRSGHNEAAIMAYDEGGEVTLERGARLVLLNFARHGLALNRSDMARQWPGGKVSHLYATLVHLWTTPPTPEALQKVLDAVHQDEVPLDPAAILITSVERG